MPNRDTGIAGLGKAVISVGGSACGTERGRREADQCGTRRRKEKTVRKTISRSPQNGPFWRFLCGTCVGVSMGLDRTNDEREKNSP